MGPIPVSWHALGAAGRWCGRLARVAYPTLSQQPAGKRTFHYVTCCITLIASCAYLFMALGAGVACIPDDGKTIPHVPIMDNSCTDGRAFLWPRYVDWSVTTPLLLLDLALLAGASWDETVFLIVADAVMVVAGLGASLLRGPGIDESARWIGFAFGCVAFVPIVTVCRSLPPRLPLHLTGCCTASHTSALACARSPWPEGSGPRPPRLAAPSRPRSARSLS